MTRVCPSCSTVIDGRGRPPLPATFAARLGVALVAKAGELEARAVAARDPDPEELDPYGAAWRDDDETKSESENE
ncbi:MAG: hypothetical protein AMXMBFR56_29310 [Polyangiaceae bacterium]